MIKRIIIKDVASFGHDEVTFDNLAKVNIIYGGNGTGKTTISRVLDEEVLREETYPRCKVEWSGEKHQIMVYNRDFRERNIRSDITGVFTLGETWVELEKKIDELRPKREEVAKKAVEAGEKVMALKWRKDKEKSLLEEHLWLDVYEPHKDMKACLKPYAKKKAFAEQLRFSVEHRDQKKAGEPGRLVSTSDAEKNRREEVTNVEELRKRYKALYGDLGEELNMSALETGRLFFERRMLDYDVWQYLAAQADKEVKRSDAVIKSLERKLTRQQKVKEKVDKELKDIDFMWEGVTDMESSVQPAIDHINEKLESHGYSGFSIQRSPRRENSYQIQRDDGSFVENTLSEGEETLITMLYFLEQLRGSMMELYVRGPVVVVIDDPISSLDLNAMGLVADEIEDLMKEARGGKELRDSESENWVEQVIVLTHNKTFHKMISSRERRRDTRYWELYKTGGVSKVTDYGHVNNVRSDYEMMWSQLRSEADWRHNIFLPNTLRRIIEEYFLDYGGYEKHKLFSGEYVKNACDKSVVTSLAKWLDEGSHRVADGGYGDLATINEQYLKKFRKLFVMMGHEAHYKMMIRED